MLMMPRDRVITFRPDDDLFEAMERLRLREGVPYSEMIRRGLRAWLAARGVLKEGKTYRRRVSARKRS